MNFFQRAWIEILRRPVKYIIFFLIFTVSFIFLLLGLTLHNVASGAKNQVMDYIGPYFQLEENENWEEDEEGESGFVIDDSILDDVSSISHVTGVNQGREEYALAENFETVKTYTGVTPDSDPSLYEDFVGLTPNSVSLYMDLDVSMEDDFRCGDSVLVDGLYPDRAHPGLMIEQSLAEQDGLAVGDDLLLGNGEGLQVTGTIIGIYRTNGTFEITGDNSVGGAVFAWSPYNRVYASLDFYESLFGMDSSQLDLSIYVDTFRNMNAVRASVKSLDLNRNVYQLVNMTEEDYSLSRQASQIESLNTYSNLILLISVVIVIILLLLVLNLFVRYYMEDAGILIALGCSRGAIVGQYLCSVSLVAVVSLILAAIISRWSTAPVVRNLISSTAVNWNITSSFETGLEHTVSVGMQALGRTGWAVFLLGVILLILISGIPLYWRMARYRPRMILAQEKE